MFKAQLVENDSYYKLKKRSAFLMLIPIFIFQIINNLSQISPYFTVSGLIICTFLFILLFKDSKAMKAILDKRSIEINGDQIRIKSSKGQNEESINLNKIDKLILPKSYTIQDAETFQGSLSGKYRENFIIIEQDQQTRKLRFETDSFYMLKQLEKLVAVWESQGFTIEKTN